MMYCPKCNATTDDSTSKFCISCGTALKDGIPEKTLADYYQTAIGAHNQDYYLHHFRKFHEKRSAGVSWHWPAFFFTFPWMIYRKMWGPALLYGVLCTIAFLSLSLIAALTGSVFGIGCLLLLTLCVFLMPAMFANALYYRKINGLIKEIEKLPFPQERQIAILFDKGGTLNCGLLAAIFIVLIFSGACMLGTLAALAIPTYQDYTVRGKIFTALSSGKIAAQMVENYYYEHDNLPDTLEEAGFSTNDLPADVQDITLDPEYGAIIITMAKKPIEGQSFYLQASQDDDGKISWFCQSDDIRPTFLPKECRE